MILTNHNNDTHILKVNWISFRFLS